MKRTISFLVVLMAAASLGACVPANGKTSQRAYEQTPHAPVGYQFEVPDGGDG